jgi:hypothetical protein
MRCVEKRYFNNILFIRDSLVQLDKKRLSVEKDLNYIENQMRRLGLHENIRKTRSTSIDSTHSSSSYSPFSSTKQLNNESISCDQNDSWKIAEPKYLTSRCRHSIGTGESFDNKIVFRKYSLNNNMPSSSKIARHRSNSSGILLDKTNDLHKVSSDSSQMDDLTSTLFKRLPKIDEIYANKRKNRKLSFTKVDAQELEIPEKNFNPRDKIKKKLSLPNLF